MKSFTDYLGALERLSDHVDPLIATPASAAILEAARSLTEIDPLTVETLSEWVRTHPNDAPVLALAVGLSQEKFKMTLRHALETSSWARLALWEPQALIEHLNDEYGLIDALTSQRLRTFSFGEVLVARAGQRVTARRATVAGRDLEDDIEAIALSLGLTYRTRTRFSGRHGREAPCDLSVDSDRGPEIVVAAKGFDSTGSKLTDAVREIEEMADVRLPTQFVMAVVDGIGWKSRQSDLRKLYALRADNRIDGLYTRSDLPEFKEDLLQAARIRGLLLD